ncbi:DNA double-strand break repair nuclease NurA [Leptolyngbya sp. AN02str]|uniref:DNA double-strand break repair nuclease NurA n=1 Tax=Leptolyngbya sp. AN02str TaxID=3423363 RepID=UPI003D3194B6
MPIKPSQILHCLTDKREAFTAFDAKAVKRMNEYHQAFEDFVSQTEEERSQLLQGHAPALGARPLESFAETDGGVVRSGLRWNNREESLAWVRDRLTGITTFAVDGSQIYPGKDLSIPVALVQIGWFENQHLPMGGYEKDIRLDVLTPHDLQAGNSGEPVDRRVNMRRFEMETQRLVEYMEAHSGQKNCLLFLDGSLVATFARSFEPEVRQFYIEALLAVLRASEAHRVPLVAYIDTSYADDVTVMLQSLYDLPRSNSIHDANLVNRLGMEWGDRVPLFLCKRADILQEYAEHSDRIAFTYLKTTRDNYPARLEMPLWMVEEGLHTQVLDWVRAEVVIGAGYPYAIETADKTAVLQAGDRQLFFRVLQEWLEQERLNLRLSRKMVSKMRRR